MSAKIKIKDLKEGHGVNHPKLGYMQYRGLATIHPFSDEPKVPHEYIFWTGVDEDGFLRPDVVIKNGNQTVEIVDEP